MEHPSTNEVNKQQVSKMTVYEKSFPERSSRSSEVFVPDYNGITMTNQTGLLNLIYCFFSKFYLAIVDLAFFKAIITNMSSY